MIVEISWESVVFVGAVLGAAAAIWKWLSGGVSWINKPSQNARENKQVTLC